MSAAASGRGLHLWFACLTGRLPVPVGLY